MKIILTEKELIGLIKKVITEQINEDDKNAMSKFIVDAGDRVKKYYAYFYSKPDTIAKFNKTANVKKIKEYIPKIKYKLINEKTRQYGFVNRDKPYVLNLNIYNLFTRSNNTIQPKGTVLYDTILHEIGHLIDFQLQRLGEKSIST